MKRSLIALLYTLLLPGALLAQDWADYDYENLEFRGLGIEAHGVWPTRAENTYAIGVRADLGYVGPHVRIMPAVRFWSSSLHAAEVDRLATQFVRICERQTAPVCPTDLDLGTVDLSDLELAADAHYVFDTGYTARPYLGAGAGLHLFNGSGDFINDTFVEDLLDTVAPALNVLGGVNVDVGAAVQLFAEARYALVSEVPHATLGVGGVWLLPAAPSALRLPWTGAR